MPTTYYHTVAGRILGETTSGVRTDYLADALGSVTATVDASQNVVNTYRYKPYGEQLAKTGRGADPRFGWTGDSGSRRTLLAYAEQYNRMRHLSTAIGMWISVDALWPREQAFGYVRGNPIVAYDPSGMQSCYRKPWDDDCKPVQEGVSRCCIPFPKCLPEDSKVFFTMTLPKKSVPRIVSGHVQVIVKYLLHYLSTDPSVSCPAPTVVYKQTFAYATSGAYSHQYSKSWCTPDSGPIPPTESLRERAYVHTKCRPGDDSAFVVGNEKYKFRIGTKHNDNPTWKPIGGCHTSIGRNKFLVHPDGRGAGTAGCIGVSNQEGSKKVRSCMHWAELFGCSKIPLEVYYSNM
jgi:RHS repeat-associated protein